MNPFFTRDYYDRPAYAKDIDMHGISINDKCEINKCPPTAPVGACATSRFVLAVKPIGYTKDLILTPEPSVRLTNSRRIRSPCMKLGVLAEYNTVKNTVIGKVLSDIVVFLFILSSAVFKLFKKFLGLESRRHSPS